MDVKIEKKSKFKTKYLGYTVLGIIAILAIWKMFFSDFSSAFKIEKDKLVISDVQKSNFDDMISINGVVAPIATIYMDAYEGGRVEEKLVEEGVMVKKGDIILRLQNRNLYEQILASENNLALKQNDLRSTKMDFDSRLVDGRKSLVNAEYEMQRFKRTYEQNKELYEEKLIAKEIYITSKEDYELAQKQLEIIKTQTNQDEKLRRTSLTDLDSDLRRMKRTLSMIYERIDQLNVRAPADGQLGFLDAEIGQSIDQGQRIGQINVLESYKIEASIDEHYIDRIKMGLEATLTRNNKDYNIKIRKIYPEVRDGKFKIDLIFLDDIPETIRTGQSYNIKLKLGDSKETLVLNKGGFYQSSGGRYVFILDETESFATKKEVRIGKQNSKYFEIIDGLEPGNKVITSSYDSFGNAEKIKLK